ncbi:hypothetical protein K0B03_01085 [Patescibacteria group bacterium]|nr:hypothetical protein [Patescibacteria group bacterium]
MSKSNQTAGMQIMTKCPLCDYKYEKKDIKVMNSKEGVVTLYLNCKNCQGSIMMLIMTGAFGITSISMTSDIMEDDFKSIEEHSCVEYDDVLEMHKFLKNK